MTILLVGIIIIALIIILYLLKEHFALKKQLLHLKRKRKQEPDTVVVHPKDPDYMTVSPYSDILDTHDRVVEMFESGESAESISERLKIPQSKVEMTLKFEKIKKNGAQ